MLSWIDFSTYFIVMLCEVCEDIFKDGREFFSDGFEFVWYDHHRVLQDLQKSVLSGCQICSACWSEVSRNAQLSRALEMPADVTGERYFTRYSLSEAWSFATEGSYELIIAFHSEGSGDSAEVAIRQFVIERFEGRISTETAIIGDGHPLFTDNSVAGHQEFPSNTDSEACYALALQWHMNCVGNHHSCNSNAKTWFPTRLLDLGLSKRDTDLRLIETDSNPPDGPYMTLSHCWGTSPITLTTNATLDQMKDHISMSSLPKTFRHAIRITRKFDIRYLWIDSLCIIQDSVDDWQHEAAQMGEVYKFSYCNIAATRSSSSHGGCFTDRANPHLLQPCIVETSWNRTLRGKCRVIDLGLWRDGVSDAPLNRRAWVVQERLLAPRVLHFGENQLWWECFELDACETYPQGLPEAYSVSDARFKHLNPVIEHGAGVVASPGWVPDPAWQFYHLWNWIVSTYMKCGLTKSEDKLIALSGIATQSQLLVKDEYLAGLWRRYLPYQLLWYVDDCRQANGRPSLRPQPYRAPSWSWASVDGDVNTTWNNPEPDSVVISILDVQVETKGTNKTGQVLNGSLRLRGGLVLIKPEEWKRDPDNSQYLVLVQNGEVGWRPDEAVILSSKPPIIYLLPVQHHKIGEGDSARIEGLVLGQTDREEVFCRQGYFVVGGFKPCQFLMACQERTIVIM